MEIKRGEHGSRRKKKKLKLGSKAPALTIHRNNN